MTENKVSDLSEKRKRYSDYLELSIVIAFLFMIISIYVPRAIWDEEELFEDKSHFYMENMYDVQNFYKSVMGDYNPTALEQLLADLNEDGTINVQDIILLVNIILSN